MRTFNRSDLHLCNNSEEILVLNSYADFECWYLSLNDLSMFSSEDISGLLDDEKPSHYPCVPLMSANKFDATYLSLDIFQHCSVAAAD